MSERTDAVVAKLRQLQGDRSDAEMADLLAVSRPHWSRVKRGQRVLSRAALLRAVAAFPEIQAEAIGEIVDAARRAS